MNRPDPRTIRNIGIISHIDAGKTTVSERILFYTGEIHKMGEVHEGAATMDWMEQEQERGITITATSTACLWGAAWINLIDTPGHIDFTIEVERSLRVLDGAVAIFSAVEGVQPQSESVWRQADRYRVPRICLINKMDRIGADLDNVLNQMENRLKAKPVLLQLPLGTEDRFVGVVDILSRQRLRFSEDDQGRTVATEPLPEDLRDEVERARERIIETAADFDDTILSDFLEGVEIEEERIRIALRKGTLECRIFPVLLGSALRNKGIQPLLDAVVSYLPSPLDVPPVLAFPHDNVEEKRLVACNPAAPLCALAFKVLSDEGRKLTYLRIYSGTLKVGADIYNSRRRENEKVARLFRMHAHKRERLDEARAGDIVAATGLKEALTGDTLCAPGAPLTLEGLWIPEPVVSIAVEPKGVGDREKFLLALEKLQWEDPTFRVHEDEETGQTILTGMGELHLDVVVRRLEKDFGVGVKTGRPQVVYRETLRGSAEYRDRFHREVDGKVHAAEILLRVSPQGRGEGVKIVLPPEGSSSLPQELSAVLHESLGQACAAGAGSGYPLTDIFIEVLDVPFEQGVTSEPGIRAASHRALSLAVREALPAILEPVMALELTVPSEYAGKVLGTLQQKRGRVEGMNSLGDTEIIKALVPLSEMFGYITELRSATKGRGTFSMEFSHYDIAPAETQRRVGFR